jgi:hypothetical protein
MLLADLLKLLTLPLRKCSGEQKLICRNCWLVGYGRIDGAGTVDTPPVVACLLGEERL